MIYLHAAGHWGVSPLVCVCQPKRPKQTLYDAKRLIGYKITDKEIIADQNNWTFDIVGDEEGNPLFKVPQENSEEVKLYRPTEVISYVLTVVR